jgi:hypothetical protein
MILILSSQINSSLKYYKKSTIQKYNYYLYKGQLIQKILILVYFFQYIANIALPGGKC